MGEEGGEEEGGDATEGVEPLQTQSRPDAAINNQSLSAAQAPPEKLEKDAWPLIVPVSKRL